MLLKKALIFEGLIALSLASSASGFVINGTGHFGLRGRTVLTPDYQALLQSTLLKMEARANDSASFFLEFRLFKNPRASVLGDSPDLDFVREGHPDVLNPTYEPYLPIISKAYAQYALDYFILEAGRRGRNWGMGAFFDDGSKPFDTGMSLYDGFSLYITPFKADSVAIAIGYDKISESGAAIPGNKETPDYSPENRRSDTNQYFASIEHRDPLNYHFRKQIGIYAALLRSDGWKDGGSNTSAAIVDVYGALSYAGFDIETEFFWRQGTTSDPNSRTYGGAFSNAIDPATNDIQSNIALASKLSYGFDSGKGDKPDTPAAFDHRFALEFIYAPGDSDGYFDSDIAERSFDKRSQTAKAVAFHENFKPALVMFNLLSSQNERVDGVFDPYRVMNATMVAGGYTLDTSLYGRFSTKMIWAKLNTTMPEEVRTSLEASNEVRFGQYSDNLGVEIDLAYSYPIRRDLDISLAGGYLITGEAWRNKPDKKPENIVSLESSIAFRL